MEDNNYMEESDMDRGKEIIYNESVLRLKEISERLTMIAIMLQEGNVEMAKSDLDDLYMEAVESSVERNENKLIRIMEHVLKLAYCDSYHYMKRDARGWKASVTSHRDAIKTNVRWVQNKRKINVIHSIENQLQDMYISAMVYYRSASEENPTLQENMKFIPEECPWTFANLMDDDILTLVEMLPNHTMYYRQWLEENPPWKLNMNPITIISDDDDE
jgi:hypothetical protein